MCDLGVLWLWGLIGVVHAPLLDTSVWLIMKPGSGRRIWVDWFCLQGSHLLLSVALDLGVWLTRGLMTDLLVPGLVIRNVPTD